MEGWSAGDGVIALKVPIVLAGCSGTPPFVDDLHVVVFSTQVMRSEPK